MNKSVQRCMRKQHDNNARDAWYRKHSPPSKCSFPFHNSSNQPQNTVSLSFLLHLKSALKPLFLFSPSLSSLSNLISRPHSSTPFGVPISTTPLKILGLIGPNGGKGFALLLASSRLIFFALVL